MYELNGGYYTKTSGKGRFEFQFGADIGNLSGSTPYYQKMKHIWVSDSASSIQLALNRRARCKMSARSGSLACAASASASAASVLVRCIDVRMNADSRGAQDPRAV